MFRASKWLAYGILMLVAFLPSGVQLRASAQSTGNTELVSVASDGTKGNYTSVDASISDNGRLVAFKSYSDNLVSHD